MRPLGLMLAPLALSACLARPEIAWPEGPAPATPALLPEALLAPPVTRADPGPALLARAAALRAELGL